MIAAFDHYDYGEQTVAVSTWQPEDGENYLCPACDQGFYVAHDGEIIAHQGRDGRNYCDEACEEGALGQECNNCGATKFLMTEILDAGDFVNLPGYLLATSFCADCLGNCESGNCRSILGNFAKAGDDRFFGVIREEYGEGVQLSPICQSCAADLECAE